MEKVKNKRGTKTLGRKYQAVTLECLRKDYDFVFQDESCCTTTLWGQRRRFLPKNHGDYCYTFLFNPDVETGMAFPGS